MTIPLQFLYDRLGTPSMSHVSWGDQQLRQEVPVTVRQSCASGQCKVARVQMQSSMKGRLAQVLGRCFRLDTCASMISPCYLSLPDFGLKLHGKLWKEREAQCCKQNPKMPQTKDTVKVIHGGTSQSGFKKKKR